VLCGFATLFRLITVTSIWICKTTVGNILVLLCVQIRMFKVVPEIHDVSIEGYDVCVDFRNTMELCN
jgi:hypothetical protein